MSAGSSATNALFVNILFPTPEADRSAKLLYIDFCLVVDCVAYHTPYT